MIDLVHAARRQPLRLIGRKEAQAGTHFQIVPRFDLRHDLLHRLDFPLARPAGRNHDAVRLAAPLRRQACPIQQLVAAEQVVLAESRPSRLSTASNSGNPPGRGRSWRSSESKAAPCCQTSGGEACTPRPECRAIPRRCCARIASASSRVTRWPAITRSASSAQHSGADVSPACAAEPAEPRVSIVDCNISKR